MRSLLVVTGTIPAVAATRVLPHPMNFTSVGAMALFGGACVRPRALGFLVPLAAIIAGDVAMVGRRGTGR